MPAKFKYGERARGLQVLRYLGVGGRHPQNRTMLGRGEPPSSAFDINTHVYGDSLESGGRLLPVRAAVSYSDALSLKPKEECVEETFHNRASEDGTLFDPVRKVNSSNLFNQHFVRPGTLLVQVVSTQGRVLPPPALDHLLLSIGLAGAYGGRTSVTGVNVRTRPVGIYAARFERAETSPYEIVRFLRDARVDLGAPEAVAETLHAHLRAVHEVGLDGSAVRDAQERLVGRLEGDRDGLAAEYRAFAARVAELFDLWFTGTHASA